MTDSPPIGSPTLRRSLHFVPGGNERMLEKALGLEADCLILDLEDSVTPDNKQTARASVCRWLQDVDFGSQQRLVRINPADSPWGAEDLQAVVAARPDGLVLPKVASREDVDRIDAAIAPLERDMGLPAGSIGLLLIGTEVPEAVFNLPAMARNPRVDGLTWGAEDLSSALGAKAKRDGEGNYLEVFSYVRSTCLLAAAAAGVQPIDAVYVDIKNRKGLAAECQAAAAMGYTGKISIHPSQIDIINEAFTPTAAEVAHAEDLVAAFEEQAEAGKMAFSFRGEMVDVPHLKRAKELLALAAHIAGQTS